MLLEGTAATWWEGVKSTVKNYDDALFLLTSVYGKKKKPYKIYREIFSNSQPENIKTDLFVCNIRALFAQLPEKDLSEKVQLDMVYGLLSFKIRDKVKRDHFKSFDELLKAAREEEELIEEENQITKSINSLKVNTFCKGCKKSGHKTEDCRKNKPRSLEPSKPDYKSNIEKHELKCYTCGLVGFVKSNCPKCNPRPSTSNSAQTNATISSVNFINLLSAEFDNMSVDDSVTSTENKTTMLKPIGRPLFNINILGSYGTGIVDTAAKMSMASSALYKLLVEKGQKFISTQLSIVLADGSQKLENILYTSVNVLLYGKVIPTTFIVLLNAVNNRTLLGIDFIRDARVVLNFAEHTWKFHEDNTVYSIHYENDNPCTLAMSSINLLRVEEGSKLKSNERNKVNDFLIQYEDIFALGGDPTTAAIHTIDTGSHAPIASPAYKMSLEKRENLRREIDKMLKDNIIEECESPWAAPVVMVKKPNGSYRVCVDYRKLNAITVSDKYPMPRIDELLHLAKRTLFMTTLDLRAGYWQVPVHIDDRDKTAFVCPFGLFRFKRMSFGLKNAPATFQRLVDRLKSRVQDVTMFAYLDDIVILSESFEQHLIDLGLVFDRLKQFNLRVNREKCSFFRDSITFLGHIIDQSGIRINPEKVSAVAQRKDPKNVKEVKSFLQTCSWYRKFVPQFSKIAQPLSNLTRKDVTFEWTEIHRASFNKLKSALITAPILQQADPTKPYTIRTDASKYAIGAVLLQGLNKEERPIEYASRLLIEAEQNYTTTEREALAVVWALNKFRGYVDGAKITIGTDHQALKWLLTLKSPTGRLARWVLLIQGFDVKIEYVPGKANLVADTLSRPPIENTVGDICTLYSFQIDFPSYKPSALRKLQVEDPKILKIIECFEQKDHPDLQNWTGRGYLMTHGVLYRYIPDQNNEEAQLVIPEGSRNYIVSKYHSDPTAGHYGVEKTIEKIRSRYFWLKMRKYIADFVKTCEECQKYKSSNLKPSGLLKTPTMQQRFEVIAIDLFGPLPATQNNYKWIFIIEDVSTKWTEIFPLLNSTAETCSKKLIEEIFLRYGLPRRIISDNGPQFVSNVMQHVADYFNIEQCLTPYYHPQANPVERRNRDLKPQIAILVQDKHTKWADTLPSIRLALNTTTIESTGYTPAYLTFGRELRVFEDVLTDLRPISDTENFIPQITPYLQNIQKHVQNAREKHETSQDRRKAEYDKKRIRQRPYKLGDLVLVTTHTHSDAEKGITKKFAPRRNGPYKISKVISSSTFEVQDIDQNNSIIGRYYTSHLTPYNDSTGI